MTELSTLCLEVKWCMEFCGVSSGLFLCPCGVGVGRLDCCLRALRGYFCN